MVVDVNVKKCLITKTSYQEPESWDYVHKAQQKPPYFFVLQKVNQFVVTPCHLLKFN